MIALGDVRAAARRLDGVAHRTPVMRSRTLDERAGARVLLKPENLQRVGAFKFRGACNALAAMEPARRERGVVTTSSGNHAQALALAARLHGVPALILMPDDAPASKVVATLGYGAEIARFDRYATDREALLAEVAEQRAMTPVHPTTTSASWPARARWRSSCSPTPARSTRCSSRSVAAACWRGARPWPRGSTRSSG
ncbi:MAG: pyridoxal-phosphate dependent enzyme [Solirubrobacterales bacterium]